MKAFNKTFDIVRLGLTSLTLHKVRSALTALGIIIGVCGVMASLAINDGMIAQSQKAFRERGTDNIVINSQKPPSEDSSSGNNSVLQYGITYGDAQRLETNIPRVLRAVRVHRTQKNAQVNSKTLNVFVIATDPLFAQVARVEMTSGRFIGAMDMDEIKAHCVITAALAEKLMPCEDPLGQTLRIGNTGDPFVIVGVLSRLPAALAGEGGDNNNVVIIPLSTDMIRYGDIDVNRTASTMTREQVQVSQMILQMADEQAVIQGAALARSLLARVHSKPDFDVSVPLEQIQMMKQQKRMMTLVSLGIAAISLVVGGIGIMNIMLASVTERTREIGIRRALGAKKNDIVTQFLVESVALTIAGGLVGIGVGLGGCYSLQPLLGFPFPPVITPLAIFFPFIMAVVVGLISGLYPAMRAANLDPITALRHE